MRAHWVEHWSPSPPNTQVVTGMGVYAETSRLDPWPSHQSPETKALDLTNPTPESVQPTHNHHTTSHAERRLATHQVSRLCSQPPHTTSSHSHPATSHNHLTCPNTQPPHTATSHSNSQPPHTTPHAARSKRHISAACAGHPTQ
jgi:hypothetical protein